MSVDRLFRWTLLTFIFLLMIQYLANDFFTEFFDGNDGITAFATVILALAALVGLSTWRTQINGQYDTDLGRRIFEALSDYEEALYDLRHAEFVLYVAETKANGVGVPEAQKLFLSSEGAKLEFNNNVRKAEETHNTSARHLTAVFKEADAMWKQSLNELAQPLLELRNSLSNLRRLIRTRDTYDGP